MLSQYNFNIQLQPFEKKKMKRWRIFKRGGFLIYGPASSGKSYLFNAFCDCFPFVGQIRPQSGYAFNFDDCPGNQLVLCEEFNLKDTDMMTKETLKDILCGNGCKVRVKFGKPKYLESMPMLFITNHQPFDLDK